MKLPITKLVLACAVLAGCDRGDGKQPLTPAPAPASTEASAPAKRDAPATPDEASAPTLRFGDKVSAQWRNGKWYPGTLTAVYSDGTADVRYDDGDRAKGLTFDKIKLVKRPMFEVQAK